MGCPWLAISGQRIFQQPFSWKSVGVDVRGRSYPLRIDYRTSYFAASTRRCGWQPESRHGTISVFNGVDRVIKTLPTWIERSARSGNGSPTVSPEVSRPTNRHFRT
jgi:hypothetical protein